MIKRLRGCASTGYDKVTANGVVWNTRGRVEPVACEVLKRKSIGCKSLYLASVYQGELVYGTLTTVLVFGSLGPGMYVLHTYLSIFLECEDMRSE